MARPVTIRDRVREFRRVPASELRGNPRNFRRHPREQRAAIDGVLREIGISGALVAYRSAEAGGALTLIDGHLRREAAASSEWPVLILDVDDAEASYLLATLDPLGAMAAADPDALAALLGGVETGEDAVAALLAALREGAGIAGGDGADDPPAGMDPGEGRYKEQYGVIVVCADEAEQERVYGRLTGEGLACRVVVT